MFRRCAARFVKTLPNGFEYTTSPTDIHTAANVEAPAELSLTLTRQDELIFANTAVKSIAIMTAEGKMGVLPGHEYVVEKLVPGVIEIESLEGKTSRYITSGGFAHVNTDGSVDLQTAETLPIESFDAANCEKELLACQELTKSGDDDAKIRGEIGVGVLEPIIEALKA